MKKIIYFTVIFSAVFFLFSNSVLAIEYCPGTCPKVTADCPAGYEQGPGLWKGCNETDISYKCCVKKDTTGGSGNTNTNNSGFGFDKVKNVAEKAGYHPDTALTLDQQISNIVGIFLSLLGVIFMVLMIYGGYYWMTAAGDEQKIDKAKDIIRAAVIGLIVVVAAYALSVFIISRIWGTP